jgi:hypothetical protein
MTTLILPQMEISAGEVKVHAHYIKRKPWKIGRIECMKSPPGDVPD